MHEENRRVAEVIGSIVRGKTHATRLMLHNMLHKACHAPRLLMEMAPMHAANRTGKVYGGYPDLQKRR